jgi:hypothetical protein
MLVSDFTVAFERTRPLNPGAEPLADLLWFTDFAGVNEGSPS